MRDKYISRLCSSDGYVDCGRNIASLRSHKPKSTHLQDTLTMSTSRLLVVVGSGPGVGSATASLFASNGFNIALISRNPERLKGDQTRVSKANSNIECKTFAADVSDSSALKKALNQIHESMGAPEVVLFNTARIAPTTIGETDPSDVAQDFQLMNIGQIVTAYWALPLLARSR